jgi:hypothetical protein
MGDGFYQSAQQREIFVKDLWAENQHLDGRSTRANLDKA